MAACPCDGLDGFELVRCLAPPRGEHEVHVDIGRGSLLVVNRDGFFLRAIHVEETLPFMVTTERRVDPRVLLPRARLGVDDLLCMAIEGLRESAASGSRVAMMVLDACSDLIEGIVKERCVREK